MTPVKALDFEVGNVRLIEAFTLRPGECHDGNGKLRNAWDETTNAIHYGLG
jgi:hypothetical protein